MCKCVVKRNIVLAKCPFQVSLTRSFLLSQSVKTEQHSLKLLGTVSPNGANKDGDLLSRHFCNRFIIAQTAILNKSMSTFGNLGPQVKIRYQRITDEQFFNFG